MHRFFVRCPTQVRLLLATASHCSSSSSPSISQCGFPHLPGTWYRSAPTVGVRTLSQVVVQLAEESEETSDSSTDATAAAPSSRKPSSYTPVMRQYLKIKREHSQYIVMFRMGDFYEMFYDDAVQASAALDITLTSRNRGSEYEVPMCGVPAHTLDVYLERFVKKGFRVAVCEQVLNSSSSSSGNSGSGNGTSGSGLLHREVKRLITPGTLVEDRFLTPRSNNHLCVVYQDPNNNKDRIGLAWMDVSTGQFQSQISHPLSLAADLAQISPVEILHSTTSSSNGDGDSSGSDLQEILSEYVVSSFPYSLPSSDSQQARQQIRSALDSTAVLAAVSDLLPTLSDEETHATNWLLTYLKHTLGQQLPALHWMENKHGLVMKMNVATRRALELTHVMNPTGSSSSKATLVGAIDKTSTAGGARLLRSRLTAPLTDLQVLQQRLDDVQYFYQNQNTLQLVRNELPHIGDMERSLQRLHLDRATPRDVLSIANGSLTAAALLRMLKRNIDNYRPVDRVSPVPCAAAEHTRGATSSSVFSSAVESLTGFEDPVFETVQAAFEPNSPLSITDGGFIRDGYDGELDEHRRTRDHGKELIQQLQDQYRNQTGIPTLKLKHNHMLGPFVEVPTAKAERIHADAALSKQFRQFQSLTGSVRFRHEDYSELYSKIERSHDLACKREVQLFREAVDRLLERSYVIHSLARSVAEVDVSASLALLALNQGFVRPELCTGTHFHITQGRHPVVESLLPPHVSFVANDCHLAPAFPPSSESESESAAAPGGGTWIVTGPNMGGKSTFLRQNALICILAQIGSFVPATHAHIGLVDALFCRVGASDDLAHHQSTFMMEMLECAHILRDATRRSFIIMDELGRGTNTTEGICIAQAVVEYIHEKLSCRLLFATHFHELVPKLQEQFGSTLTSATTDVIVESEQQQQKLIFTHRIRLGVSSQSYAIPVSKLAGLPQSILDRAEQLHQQLKSSAN